MADESTLIANYHPFASKAKTFVSLFERYENQVIINFKTWLSKTAFEAIPRRPPYKPLCFEYPLIGQRFDDLNQTAIQAIDEKIREIGNLSLQGLELDSYSINALDKIFVINTKPSGNLRAPIISFVGQQFDSIMMDETTYQTMQKAQELCWNYGASVESYLLSLVSGEE